MANCDFCGTTNPSRLYDARAVITQRAFIESGPEAHPPMEFSPVWAACDACGAYLDARDFDGLKQHVIRIYSRNPEFEEMFASADGLALADEMIFGVYKTLASGPLKRTK